jgi:hypothetical protein
VFTVSETWLLHCELRPIPPNTLNGALEAAGGMNGGAQSKYREDCQPRTVITILIVAVIILASIDALAQTQTSAKTNPVRSKPGLTLTTEAFTDGGIIPPKYTMAAAGDAVSPKLMWTNVPGGTLTSALILRGSDTSIFNSINQVVHWVIFNIPGSAA